MENITIKEKELAGIKRMKELNEAFLRSGKGSDSVRNFLTKADKNEELLRTYLKGRKYRPEHAWETLKRKAEVRFDEYPDIFREEEPESLSVFHKRGIWGVLKSRDSHGRRILTFNTGAWDPTEYTYDELLSSGVYIAEALLRDEDAMTNGVVLLQNCDGMGWRHAKQYTLPAMLKCLAIFWYGMPLLFKGLHLMNIPSYLFFIVKLIEPFLAKKLKERLQVTTKSKSNSFEVLHKSYPPEILPKFLGGDIEGDEAFEDLSYYRNFKS